MIATTEYELLRESAGLVDRSARGKLRLTGSEAAEFLQGQVTNDVEALKPGEGCYAALLTHKGKVVADMRILRGEDFLLIDSEPWSLPALKRNVDMYSIGRDVKWTEETETTAILSLVGPTAREGLDVHPPETEHAWAQGEHGIYVTTDSGVDIICAADDAGAVREALGIPLVSNLVNEQSLGVYLLGEVVHGLLVCAAALAYVGRPVPARVRAIVLVPLALSEWSAHHRKLRPPHRHGAGAWRASAR